MDDINEESEPVEPTEGADETLDMDVDPTDLTDDTTEPEGDAVQDGAVPDEDAVPDENTLLADAPPPPFVDPQAARLTRDPYASFGGVLSGIAHRYGWDVSLTRLAFVVLLVVSGGTAIFAYFLAWLIIPRALHWPPVRVSGRGGSSRLSGRDLGIGLIGLGALVVLGIGSGEAAAVLVPLALVAAGVWLLVQSPRDEVAAGVDQMANPRASFAQPVAGGAPYSMPLSGPQTLQPTASPQPVPKRSRLRRVGLIGLFGFLGLLLLLIVAIPVILIAGVTSGEWDIDADRTYAFIPSSLDDVPMVITEDAGEIILDLRGVDFSGLDEADPIRIDVNLDFGRIEVVLPENVPVSIDAETDLGDVNVFGSSSDGINPSRGVVEPNAVLDIELDLNVGEIVVRRDAVSSITTTIVEVG